MRKRRFAFYFSYFSSRATNSFGFVDVDRRDAFPMIVSARRSTVPGAAPSML
jgi:hypothetical protein